MKTKTITQFDANLLTQLALSPAQAQELLDVGISLQEYADMQANAALSEAEHSEPVPVRFKLVGQGGSPFFVNDATGEAAKTLTVKIPFFHTARVMFDQSDENSDETKPPLCNSSDGKIGRYTDESDVTAFRECASCPFNQFGSDPKTGTGKACKTLRRLYVLVDGNEDIPAIINLPPSSLKTWDKFASAVRFRGQMVSNYEIKFSLEGKSRGQFQWAELKQPEIVRELSPVERAKVMKIGRELEEHHREVTVGVEDYLAINIPAPATEPEASAAQ